MPYCNTGETIKYNKFFKQQNSKERNGNVKNEKKCIIRLFLYYIRKKQQRNY